MAVNLWGRGRTFFSIINFLPASELEEAIESTQSTLDGLYGDPIMNSTPYHLHAVLVHQGQASLGE